MARDGVRVGAVDIGTNSVRLLVADVGNGAVRKILRRAVVTGLGRGVDAAGMLSPEAIERTVAVLAGYRRELQDLEVERSRAVATSASRDAANREDFLSAGSAALGMPIDLISGEEEALLSFAGATIGLDARPPYLVIDPGGGSTEFVYGTSQPEFISSVDVGSVRLTERALRDRPASPDAVARAAAMAAELMSEVDVPRPVGTAFGVGGTFTALAAIALDLVVYDPDAVHGTLLSIDGAKSLSYYLAGLTVEETKAIPSLDPARAPVILAGAVVVWQAMALASVSSVVVSENDILTGMAMAAGHAGPG